MGILYSKGVRYSGSGKIDATLSTSSANAIANSAVATAINQINSDLTAVSASLTALRGELLWTNSSPSSAMAIQNITLDTTDVTQYTYLKIEFIGRVDFYSIQEVAVNKKTILFSSVSATGGVRGDYRQVLPYDSTHLTIGDNYYCIGTSGTAVKDNAFNIPTRIWGIKSLFTGDNFK